MSLEKIAQVFELDKIIVEIYGLGYVGFPLAVRLAVGGIHVTGIDINKKRLERLESENLMDSEIHLKEEFLNVIKNRCLKLENQPTQTSQMKIGIICVPTPIPNKEIKSDTYVISAVESFLKASKKGDLLIQFDCSLYEAQKDVVSANANSAFIKLKSDEQMLQMRSIGKYELELSISEYEKAKSELRIAELNVERCQIGRAHV